MKCTISCEHKDLASMLATVRLVVENISSWFMNIGIINENEQVKQATVNSLFNLLAECITAPTTTDESVIDK